MEHKNKGRAANLGLATNEDLIAELATRIEVDKMINDLPDRFMDYVDKLEQLREDLRYYNKLTYRTVDEA